MSLIVTVGFLGHAACPPQSTHCILLHVLCSVVFQCFDIPGNGTSALGFTQISLSRIVAVISRTWVTRHMMAHVQPAWPRGLPHGVER